MFKIKICVVLFICFGCSNNRAKINFISKEDYPGYLDIKDDDWCSECRNKIIKEQTFIFKNQIDLDFNNVEHEFLILRHGAIYRGLFNDTITVKEVRYCLDENLTKLNMIAFVLLDKESKMVYKWYKKESYYLFKGEVFVVNLKDDGTFKLRIK